MFVFIQPLSDSIKIALITTIFVVSLYLICRVRFFKSCFTPRGHIFQIVILVFPITLLFFFLVLNRLLVHLISTLVLMFLFVVILEGYLRKVLKSEVRADRSFRLGNRKLGLRLPFEEARFATGNYPREYLTEKFFHSIRNISWKQWPFQDFQSNDPSIHFDENNNVDVEGFSIVNGLRTTTDQPEDYDFNILIFGGSTTLMIEVPDDLTFASYLQRRLNIEKKVRVVNHGVLGATVLNRVSFLVRNTAIDKGDVVVLYFGVNDCGHIVNGRDHSSLRSPLFILFGRIGARKSEIGKWIRGELLFRHNYRCSIISFNSTVSAIDEAKKFVESRDAKLVVVLQPNLFVSKTKSEYEESIASRWSVFVVGQVKCCYPMYESFIMQCGYGISLTTIFDNLDNSVYLDWCHVNARGAEIIANSMHSELHKLNLV